VNVPDAFRSCRRDQDIARPEAERATVLGLDVGGSPQDERDLVVRSFERPDVGSRSQKPHEDSPLPDTNTSISRPGRGDPAGWIDERLPARSIDALHDGDLGHVLAPCSDVIGAAYLRRTPEDGPLRRK
jgi:hypothetical protein